MATISNDLKQELERNPNTVANVIVLVKDEASVYTNQVRARGITIRRAYTLIHGLALSGSGSAIIALASEPWVVSIEEDKQVHTM